MYDKCYFCLDQLPKLKKESTASFFVNFGGAGVQKSRPTLLYMLCRSTVLLSLVVFCQGLNQHFACHLETLTLNQPGNMCSK